MAKQKKIAPKISRTDEFYKNRRRVKRIRDLKKRKHKKVKYENETKIF